MTCHRGAKDVCLSANRTRLEDVAKVLVDTAMGRDKADLVIKGGCLVNVNSGEVLEGVGVAVKCGRIATVGAVDYVTGDETMVIDAERRYVAPGFLDGHVHVESSMITLTQFARAVMPRGTTTVFTDPHEIANVFGVRGVRLMLEEAKRLPLKVLVCVPSCVPSAPAFETTGAEITRKEVEEALKWDGVIGLGEMMNYPGVLTGDEEVYEKIRKALRAGKVVEGHADSLLDGELAAYAAAGITSCHESTRKIDGVQRLRLGLYAMIREGSAWRDVAEVIKCVTEERLDPRHVVLVTDDRDPKALVCEGHVDHVVRRAIEEGVDPITAIQMATLNTAEHFGVSADVGSIAPGKCADLIILNSLSRVELGTVIADGVILAKDGKMLIDIAPWRYPTFVRRSIHLKRPLTTADFLVRSPKEKGGIKVRIIGVTDGKSLTDHLEDELVVQNGKVQSSGKKDTAKVAVVERHRGTGNIGLGFVRGFGLKCGAVASSVAHDSHNLLVLGLDDPDMAEAVNILASMGGGIVAVKDSEVIGSVALPIGGLISNRPLEKVYTQLAKLDEAWRKLGCTLGSPFMTMSLLALPVLPELRITDKGLVDTKQFKFVSLFVEK